MLILLFQTLSYLEKSPNLPECPWLGRCAAEWCGQVNLGVGRWQSVQSITQNTLHTDGV